MLMPTLAKGCEWDLFDKVRFLHLSFEWNGGARGGRSRYTTTGWLDEFESFPCDSFEWTGGEGRRGKRKLIEIEVAPSNQKTSIDSVLSYTGRNKCYCTILFLCQRTNTVFTDIYFLGCGYIFRVFFATYPQTKYRININKYSVWLAPFYAREQTPFLLTFISAGVVTFPGYLSPHTRKRNIALTLTNIVLDWSQPRRSNIGPQSLYIQKQIISDNVN
jgi:hypothetical protein